MVDSLQNELSNASMGKSPEGKQTRKRRKAKRRKGHMHSPMLQCMLANITIQGYPMLRVRL